MAPTPDDAPVTTAVRLVAMAVTSSARIARRLRGGAQRPEGGAEFGAEQRRMFPRREVATAVHFMEVDQLTEGTPRPRLGGAIDLIGEHRDRHGHRDLVGLLRGGAGQVLLPVLPVNACCRGGRVRQPIER